MSVRKMLKNAMDTHETRITYKSISASTSIYVTTISRYFLRQKELTFFDLLKVIRFVAPSQEQDIIRLLILEYIESPKPINVRSLLLYLANERMFEELYEFGDSEACKTRENCAWYELIKLAAQHKKNEISGFDLIQAALSVDVDTAEIQALKHLLFSFGSMRQGRFNHFFEITETAEKFALSIRNDYIRECLMTSVSEQFANAYLFQRADTKKARFYARFVHNSISNCKVTRVNNEYTMGVSYMFEDFDKSLEHLRNCVRGLRMLGKNTRARTIEMDDIAFLHNYWRVDSMLGSDEYDESQKAYCYFLAGDVNKAKEVVERLGSDPFNTFLKGLIYGEESFLAASCMQYRCEGNELFAQLPFTYITQDALREVVSNRIA